METVARALAKRLEQHGVRVCTLLSGGMTAFLADEIAVIESIELVNFRHEQAAGFAAEGASRILGNPQVALATSGPGATNLITAIASCYFDSTATVFITGQVNRKDLRRNHKQRQNGFQETNIVEMIKSITKFAYQVSNKEEVIPMLDKCFEIARSGRMGPCLIDIPIDIQQQLLESSADRESRINPEEFSCPMPEIEEEKISLLVDKLVTARKPMILVGGGVRQTNCVSLLEELSQILKIPIVSSLQGLDAAPIAGEFFAGFIGTYGNSWANRALLESDFVLVLGSRLDPRQTGSDVEVFCRGKFIVRFDIDPEEMWGRVSPDLGVLGDLGDTLPAIINLLPNKDHSEWLNQIKSWEADSPQESVHESVDGVNPNALMSHLASLAKYSNGFVVDVGQHQMWAAQSVIVNPKTQRFLTSAGLGAMGFALPTAIGCAIVQKGRWVVITGDGCLQLSLSELQTLFHLNLEITIVVMNNGQHGMVAQFQEENLESRFVGTRDGYSTPNFAELAEAIGIKSYRVSKLEDLSRYPEVFQDEFKFPVLIEVMVSQSAKALPKMTSHHSD